MKKFVTLLAMMAATLSMWSQPFDREEFLRDFDSQIDNSERICPKSLKSAALPKINPGGGKYSSNITTDKIRRTAPTARIAGLSEGTLLDIVTNDKLLYAVYLFEDSSTPVATLIGWADSDDYYPDVVVPDEIMFGGQAVPVTTINDFCFYYGWGLTSLSIGKNVKDIGAFSFYGCSFTELSIPESVTAINGSAFMLCPLNSIYFENPDSQKEPIEIGDLAFAYTDIKSIEIPARLKVVGDFSFYQSRRNPFMDCSKLESITINPKYYDRDSYRNYTLEINQGALCSRLHPTDIYPEYLVVITYPSAKYLEEFSLTSPVVQSFEGAFYGSNIRKVSLTATSDPRTVDGMVSPNMGIDYHAFDFSGITELNLSAKGPIIIRTPFALDCYNLPNYNLSESITNFKMIDGALYAKKDGEVYLISYPSGRTDEKYIVSNDILHLEDYCFATNMNIKEITLPANLKSIGNYAFAFSENLERINYQGSLLESVGYNAFTSTKVISSSPLGEVSLGKWLIGYSGWVPSNLVISENVNNAVDGIFSYGNTITSVIFPPDFENIPNDMFLNCFYLTNVQFSQNLKTIGQYAFDHAGSLVDTPNSRSTELNTLRIPDGVTEIGLSAFSESQLGDKLILPASLSMLDNYSLGGYYKEVEIHRCTPPANKKGTQSIFNTKTLLTGTLIIPKDADPLAFSQNPYWNFLKIINGEFSSVNVVEIEPGKINVSANSIFSTTGENFTLYATDGRVIGNGNSFSGLNPGVYIVRLGSSVQKYIIR